LATAAAAAAAGTPLAVSLWAAAAATAAAAAAATVALGVICLEADVGAVKRVLELGIIQLAHGGLHVILSGIVHHSKDSVVIAEHLREGDRAAAAAHVVLQVLPRGRGRKAFHSHTELGPS